MSLLEMGVQLMILPATSFRTMNWRHPILVFRVFSAVQELVSLIRGSLFHTVLPWHGPGCLIDSALYNSLVSSCTFPRACRERTFHVPIVVPSFGSLMVVFASVAHLSPPPWSLTVGYAVVVDPGLDRSGMLFLCCLHHVLLVGLGKAWWRPSPLQVPLNW